MKSSPGGSAFRHIEAEVFVSHYEKKYNRETKKLKKNLGIAHMEAQHAAAKKFGLQRHHSFLKRLRDLRTRADHFALQEERIRCATTVQPSRDEDYYWFHANLGLDEEGHLMTESVACCFTTWIGFVNNDPTRDLREGALVHPDRVQKKFAGQERHSLYVIDDELALGLWLIAWGGFALVPQRLVKENRFLGQVIAPREYPPNSL